MPQVNSARVSNSFEVANFIQYEETIPNSPKNSLFDELSSAVSNSDSSNAIRSESDFIESKKECRKIVFSDKQISINTSIGKNKMTFYLCLLYTLFNFIFDYSSFLSPAGSNSDSLDGVRSDFINKKECKKIVSSDKQISVNASIGK